MSKPFEELSEEVAKLNTRAKRTDLTTDTLIDSLAFTRDAARRLKQEYDESTKDIKSLLKPFDDTKRSMQKLLDSAEEHFAGDLLKTLQAERELPSETKNGVRLTVALLPRLGLSETVKGYDAADAIMNECGIEQFLRPLADCIDWKKVEDYLQSGNEMPVFAVKTEAVSLRTKLPDVIE